MFEADERPRVMAWASAAWVVPALVAPAAAGTVAEGIGWRWVFAGLIPLVAAAAALALPFMGGLPGSEPKRSLAAEASGGARLAAGMGLMLTAIAREPSIWMAAALIVGVGLAAPAARRILPAGTLRAAAIVPAAIATKLLLGFAFFGTEAFVPLALTDIHGTTAAAAGLTLTIAALSWTSAAFLQARLADRLSSRVLGVTGVGVVLAAIAAISTVLGGDSPWQIAFGAWALAGAGMGVAYNTINTTAMAHSPKGDEGELSTSLGVADSIGISLGTGLGGAIVGFGDRALWSTAESLSLSWTIMGAVAIAAGVAAWRMGSVVVGSSQSEATPDGAARAGAI